MATGGTFLSTYTLDLEIFVLHYFVQKYFCGPGYSRKLRFHAPRFSDVERDYARQENVDYEKLAAFVATTQVGELFACEREPRNAVSTYCLVSEPDPRREIGKEGLVNRLGWRCTLRPV